MDSAVKFGPDSTLSVVQITDLHFCAPADDILHLHGNTNETLQRVRKQILRREVPFDCVIATGDLVHVATAEVYERLLEVLSGFDHPVYCLPGNHDEPELLTQILNQGQISTPRRVVMGSWVLVLLDSSLRGEVRGRLSDTELACLDETLEHHQDKHVLVCVHHHPVVVGSRWMDQIKLSNSETLLHLIDQHCQVRGIVWGHIHQEFEGWHRGVKLYGTPSTCLQFKPHSEELIPDSRPPAYRRLKLNPDGTIETSVCYL